LSTGCITCTFEENEFNIKKSFISISKLDFCEEDLFEFKKEFQIENFGIDLNLKNSINYSLIQSQLRVKTDTLNYNKIPALLNWNASDKIIPEPDTKVFFKLSDIFYNEDKYLVLLNRNEKVDYGIYTVYLSNDFLYEFEVCELNGLIAFRSWSEFLGYGGEDFTTKGPRIVKTKIENITCYDN